MTQSFYSLWDVALRRAVFVRSVDDDARAFWRGVLANEASVAESIVTERRRNGCDSDEDRLQELTRYAALCRKWASE